ncbi:hypothetical protein F5Y18DRAFT_421957 [Xylariaceae sp. FL1019]|nr:hypothetical protein F5Y18DRAFT_421957 [Xylariaceae sp. FL1019]
MSGRHFVRGLPTPSTGNRRSSRLSTIPELVEDDDISPCPASKRQKTHSIRPIFETTRYQEHNEDNYMSDTLHTRRSRQDKTPPRSPSPPTPKLKESYRNLGIKLHSVKVTKLEGVVDAARQEIGGKIDANLATLSELHNKAKDLSVSPLSLHVDTQITDKDGQNRTSLVSVGEFVSNLEKNASRRQRKLEDLWASWTDAQADIDELSAAIKGHRGSKSTKGMSSSNRGWVNNEIAEIDGRSKQTVDDMHACEEKFQNQLDEEAMGVVKMALEE